MKIVHAAPPMYDEIDAAFQVRGIKGVCFAWGPTLYVPDGHHIPPELMAHEAVHYERQGSDTRVIEGWWRRYLVDPEFRLAEEVPAHRAEYDYLATQHKDRNKRVLLLHRVASRLSGPLYGGLITPSEARRRIAA